MDAASSLALLQEDVTSEYPIRDYTKYGGSTSCRRLTSEHIKATGVSVPPTPTKPLGSFHSDEKKGPESNMFKPAEDRLRLSMLAGEPKDFVTSVERNGVPDISVLLVYH